MIIATALIATLVVAASKIQYGVIGTVQDV